MPEEVELLYHGGSPLQENSANTSGAPLMQSHRMSAFARRRAAPSSSPSTANPKPSSRAQPNTIASSTSLLPPTGTKASARASKISGKAAPVRQPKYSRRCAVNMRYRVSLTARAVKDIDSIFQFIQTEQSEKAATWFNGLHEALRTS